MACNYFENECLNKTQPAFFQANCFHLPFVYMNPKYFWKTRNSAINEKTPMEACVCTLKMSRHCVQKITPLVKVNLT